jgi:DnaK suppressor protein
MMNCGGFVGRDRERPLACSLLYSLHQYPAPIPVDEQEDILNLEFYQRKLRAAEQEILSSLKKTIRDQPQAGGSDEADVSVYSQQKELIFAQADYHSQVLAQIREALERIDDGTYGQCPVDGETIAKARLDAVPWATYCVKHQSLFDDVSLPAAA